MYRLQKLAPEACERMIAEAVLHPRTPDYVEAYRFRCLASLFILLACISSVHGAI